MKIPIRNVKHKDVVSFFLNEIHMHKCKIVSINLTLKNRVPVKVTCKAVISIAPILENQNKQCISQKPLLTQNRSYSSYCASTSIVIKNHIWLKVQSTSLGAI